MAAYILRRLALAASVVVAVSFAAFVGFGLSPKQDASGTEQRDVSERRTTAVTTSIHDSVEGGGDGRPSDGGGTDD